MYKVTCTYLFLIILCNIQKGFLQFYWMVSGSVWIINCELWAHSNSKAFFISSANVIKNDVFDESLNANYYELYFEL